MIDATSTENATHNLPILSVSEISGALKMTVEHAFPRVRIRGEISGFKRAASGHLYFTLKDEDAVLDGVCWRGTVGRLAIDPEDGMEIIATGRLTTYAGRSKYQVVVEAMELAGEGALLKLLEERRRKLAEEGLFDVDAKRELPFLPDVIGVVTSPTGAVIRDILHRLDDRFPRPVLVWPVLVQGDGAAEQVAAAIEGFNGLTPGGKTPRPDLLIVARGGGSIEDLWAFNEEIVVRAAAASDIPLISAVGHETDTTLIDFASDRRAPTPTAAAEMAVPVKAELLAQVMDDGLRMANAIRRTIDDNRGELRGLVRGLPDPVRLLESSSQRLDDWTERLGNGLRVGMEQRRRDLASWATSLRKPDHQIRQAERNLTAEVRNLSRVSSTIIRERKAELGRVGALLESYSYERVLERGFTLITDDQGRAVGSIAGVNAGDHIGLRFHDGGARATVDTTTAGSTSGGSQAKSRKPRKSGGKKPQAPPTDDWQGSLL